MSLLKSITNHGRIRRSALLMLAALAAEVGSLQWRHPLSVYVFGAIAALFALLSIVSLLLSLISRPAEVKVVEQVESDDEDEQSA
ncbi:MAG TPA: hypothetical protein VJW75_07420 [Candidatus Eisenbacteria bacterium]|nr:hypothetical protein [Candidatus Eisenbacteria bacterium]